MSPVQKKPPLPSGGGSGRGPIRRWVRTSGLLTISGFILATAISYQPIARDFERVTQATGKASFYDRYGERLSYSFKERWNNDDRIALHHFPPLLKTAFLFSEDKRFYQHGGVDWLARAAAFRQWLEMGTVHRGASTLTEQVVRMLHPRPRTLWSKWIETVEATMLESSASKEQIFEFYLNQVPYAGNRRGVAQAANYYFQRDVSTLSPREMLALTVLVRAPSRFDPYRDDAYITRASAELAARLYKNDRLSDVARKQVQAEELFFTPRLLTTEASHFLRYAQQHMRGFTGRETTLDGGLQDRLVSMVQERLHFLRHQQVNHAALLVADHRTGEILSWVVAGEGCPESGYKKRGCQVDMVLRPRQPGSALKPFLYAAALEKGWQAYTVIKDTPYSEAIGGGLHDFRNYSNRFYGRVSLRQALGNSLNIPALKTIRYVGVEDYLKKLKLLGFTSLRRPGYIYDEGLALGNGEVSLFELVQGYSTLANRGRFQPLRINNAKPLDTPPAVYNPAVASLIGNILSDPWAREWEFDRHSILNLPQQTAVKTGTSTDYRDAWAVGYNDRFVVGVWMGNLNRTPMREVTGSTGPALLLRSAFQELSRKEEGGKLWLSTELEPRNICVAYNEKNCQQRTEYFLPHPSVKTEKKTATSSPQILRPTEGLQMAFDPRVPAKYQQFRFVMHGLKPGEKVRWKLNGKEIAVTDEGTYPWQLERGKYTLEASIASDSSITAIPDKRHFIVK